MKTNTKSSSFEDGVKLAGGFGLVAAKQDATALLRRAVLTCLLGEDLAYESGESVKDNIRALIPQVNPSAVAELALEARNKQKLRHVPLFMLAEMCQHPQTKGLVGNLLPQVIQRADELAEFLAIYWANGKRPIAKQAKLGLAEAFNNFNEYQFAKYDRSESVRLRDVMFLVHPKPKDSTQEELFVKIANKKLDTPDTWEVAYSAAKSSEEKRDIWIRLISEHKLGALAFIRNLRNMIGVDVPDDVIRNGLREINPSRLLPLNILTAGKNAPAYVRDLEDLFFRSFEQAEKLPGKTILIVDVSGSMTSSISSKSTNTRLDVAYALAVLATELCEDVRIYATAGNDFNRIHNTDIVPAYRGFGLVGALETKQRQLGGGGIFTRQCLEYIKEREHGADRIIVFSDSQDCDRVKKVPVPFGSTNYIVDVSAHKRGINYAGVWTAEIAGWSENFFDFILASEGLNLQNVETN
jgi:60 kDa SS-A/Ro ribonucleoprotein